jgi:hypothetical protein
MGNQEKTMNESCRRWAGIVGLLLAFVLLAPDYGIAAVRAVVDPNTGQVEVTDGDQPALRYNYRTVEPPEGYLEAVHANARKYARPRSNYIHPLYGPNGEVLTKDWSKDHPHHRGIYWAWPEVQYKGEMGDLHALQRVFARPNGNLQVRNEVDYTEIVAENLWKWEDKVPIVRERATIRTWKTGDHGRYVDLEFRFTALEDGVTLARRGTKAYGGLNIRLSPVANHEIVFHTDPADAQPRMAWADSVGERGGKGVLAFAVFQHQANPHSPGDWVQYPNLPWFQPTFPAAGAREALKKGEPLVLKFRLWIRRGGKPDEATYRQQWTTYHTP